MKLPSNLVLPLDSIRRKAIGYGILFALLTAAFPLFANAQLTGKFVSDPAIPSIIATPTQGSQYFVLNQDLSTLRQSSVSPSSNLTCAAPTGLSASGTAPRTLLNDDTNAYLTALASSGTGSAASAVEPGSSTCPPAAAALSIPGGVPNQSFTSNDPGHGRFYVVSAFGGNGPDTLTVLNNLNTNTSSTPTLTQQAKVSLDTGAQYTSIVTDVHSSYGLTAITELKTSTSPGNLWVYSPGIQTPFKILGPGGVPLPALNAFIIPAQNNANGDLLVLVNQDGLTSSNLSSPPQVTNPFTIIDLGQLQRTFSAVVSSGSTVTLPFVTQIQATTPYYAMLGATYSPVFHVIYALVAGGTSTTSVTQNIIRYDPTNPAAPAETVVADVSNIPFTFGLYPQLALNAASGTMEILTPSPFALYHVPVAGKGNTATQVTGTPFPDSNFKPTYIASNGLLGETYIASQSGQIDILTRAATSLPRATIELYGTDNAIANQSYTLYATTTAPTSDTDLNNANVTFTAIPKGGTAFTLGTGPVYTYGATNSFLSATFPSAGVYTIVASVPATTNYPALTSLPLTVTVGATGVTGVYPTTLALTVPANSSITSVSGSLTLTGNTYAPTGRIIVSDATGAQVGRYNFTGAATPYPVTVALTLPNGSSTLTAVYNGDDQNQTSTSPAASIVVGNLAKPTLGLNVPSTGSAGGTLTGSVFFSSSSTTAPTGNILIQSLPASSTTPVTLATVSAATAFANPTTGVSFTATAPSAGSYTLFASYAGDVTYSSGVSTNNTYITTTSLVGTNLNISAPSSPTAGVAFTTNVTLSPKTASTVPPTGNVTLTATLAGSTTPAATTTVPATSAFASGGVAIPATLNTVGSYTLTATFPGDTTYAASTNSIVIAVSAPAKTTPTLGLTVPTTATVGDKLIGTMTYTFAGTVVPTGNIIISLESSNGTITPTVSIPASNARNSLITAFTFTAPASGVYSVYAKYDGDSSFNAATSNVTTLNVYGTGPTTTALNISGPAYVQPNTNFNITVTLTPKTLLQTAITGNVTVRAYVISSTGLPVIFGSVTAAQASKAGGVVVTGQIPDYAVGGWQLTATYDGDANYGQSTATIGVTEFQPTKLVIAPPTVAYANTAANISVQLISANPASGNIFISSTLNGVAGPSATTPAGPAVSGVGVPMTFPSAGTYVLTATYLGDNQTGSSIAPSINVVVNPPLVGPQFTLNLDHPELSNKGTPLVLQVNTSASEGMTLKSVGGFNTSVNLSFAGDPNDLSPTFTDDAGKVITSITPTAAGVHIKARFSNGITLAQNTPLLLDSNAPAWLACGLIGAFLIARRKHHLRNVCGLRLLGLLAAAVLSFLTLTGFNGTCNVATDRFAKIVVTATPSTTIQSAAIQTADIFTDYLK